LLEQTITRYREAEPSLPAARLPAINIAVKAIIFMMPLPACLPYKRKPEAKAGTGWHNL
jgi:hypothetical protein